jgi:predicted transposase YbfD/YdcC
MKEVNNEGLISCLSIIKDPGIDRTKRHPLVSVLFIGICSVLCGAESWEQMEDFGNERNEWIHGYVELPHGIPSHDTFGRVFAQIDSKAFQESFLGWVKLVSIKMPGQIISIDGKTLRRSHDRAKGKEALHLVSAWAGANHLVLGQVKTDDKSNEITAIPELLKLLDLCGSIVTVDAMGTQKEIAKEIHEKKANYVMALKGNQGLLHDDVKAYWEDPQLPEKEYQSFETVDKGHGRMEIRRYRISSEIEWLTVRKDWEGLQSIGLVESERIIRGQTTLERRYYLSSLKADAKEFARAVREHWSIENQLHWSLDVSFREDQCRVRIQKAAENFALLRRMALHILKQDKTQNKSINRKRWLAAMRPDYLSVLLEGI